MAERFELYIDGVELANGYHELLDPAELRARNAAANLQRQADGKSALTWTIPTASAVSGVVNPST